MKIPLWLDALVWMSSSECSYKSIFFKEKEFLHILVQSVGMRQQNNHPQR
jgi:hypothetical protein